MEVNELKWLAGAWRGKGLGGECEEIWSEPAAGEMLGMFRLIRDDKVAFYELMTIEPQGESWIMRIKHFDPELVGWEEKDESVVRAFVTADRYRLDFEGISYGLNDRGELLVEMLVREHEMERKVNFVYRKVQP